MLFRHLKTRSGIIGYAVLTLFVVVAGTLAYLKFTHRLTPGPLANYQHNGPLGGVSSHAELETRCQDCHVPMHCLSEEKCQECHVQIAEDKADVNTLHGRLPSVSRCQTCHPEHKGADAELVKLDHALPNIDHYALVGYSLAAHQQNYDGSEFSCASCHADNGEIRETLDCVGCHTAEDPVYMDEHMAEYGPRCTECHDGLDRMMIAYDHDENLPLHGGHADLVCAECHGETYTAGMTAECIACHLDPEVHAGEFGLDCARCHSDVAWTPAELKYHVFDLEHGREEGTSISYNPEDGETCQTCHVDTYARYTCDGCHLTGETQYAHVVRGVSYAAACHTCHPTGQDGELVAGPAASGQFPVSPVDQSQNVLPGNTYQDVSDHSGKDG